MSDEMEQPSKPIELSEEELDAIAGGRDISLSFSFFKETDVFSSQTTTTDQHGSSVNSVFASRNIVSYTFQAVGLNVSNIKFLKRLFRGL